MELDDGNAHYLYLHAYHFYRPQQVRIESWIIIYIYVFVQLEHMHAFDHGLGTIIAIILSY